MYRRFVTALGPVLFAMFLMIPPTMGQQVQGGIVWYGVLADGLAEAERTGKPILLISAAPQCVGVSGMWWPGKQNTDRSFLTQPEIVEASRQFICIRLATYEDAAEAEFLKQIFTGKSGELENTVFCILAPDGQETLTRAGRGPHFAFRTPTAMATAMNRFAEQYPGKNDDDVPRLPQMKNFRLGLNVAECDGLPIVVCLANDSREMNKLHHKISPLAFSNELSGKFAYASVTDPKELQTLVGEKPESGFLVVAPGTYGLDGQIETTIPADVSAADLAIRLSTFAKAFQGRDKEHHDHVRTGRDSGIDWQTEIPVTDPMANAARGRDPRGIRGGPPHGRGGPPPRGGPPRGEWGPPKGPPPGKGKGKDKKRRKKEDRD